MTLIRTLIAALLVGGSSLMAQAINWQRVVDLPKAGQLPLEPLSAPQRQQLESAIVASQTVWDDCEGDNDWPHQIEVHRVDIGTGHFTLAEAGVGCARGGQGANGAMWLLRWEGARPVVLGELDGWFDAVVPGTGNGLRDVAVGWHDNDSEYGLALYRFNGKQYRLVDGTTVHCDDASARCRATAARGKGQRSGAVATPTKESAQP